MDTNQDTVIDLTTIQKFREKYEDLETRIAGGQASLQEQLVYLHATIALRAARSDYELWLLLQQQRELSQTTGGNALFPQAYRDQFISAGKLYQELMNTLAPYPGDPS